MSTTPWKCGDEPLTAPLTLLLSACGVTLGLPDIDPDTGESVVQGRPTPASSSKLLRGSSSTQARRPWYLKLRLFAGHGGRGATLGVGARAYTGTLNQTDRQNPNRSWTRTVRVPVASIPSNAVRVLTAQHVPHGSGPTRTERMLVEQAQGRLNRRGQTDIKDHRASSLMTPRTRALYN